MYHMVSYEYIASMVPYNKQYLKALEDLDDFPLWQPQSFFLPLAVNPSPIRRKFIFCAEIEVLTQLQTTICTL